MTMRGVQPGDRGRATEVARAFTFVELMVVLVVGAIIASGVSASLGGLTAQRRTTAARQLQRDLSFARERAIATSLNHWVVLDTASDWYAIRSESSASPGFASAGTILDPATGMPFIVQLNREPFPGVDLAGVTVPAGSAVGFDPRGRPLATSGALLTTAASITFAGSTSVSVEARSGRSSVTP